MALLVILSRTFQYEMDLKVIVINDGVDSCHVGFPT